MTPTLIIHGNQYTIIFVSPDAILLERDNKKYSLMKGKQLTWVDWDCSLIREDGTVFVESIPLSHIPIHC